MPERPRAAATGGHPVAAPCFGLAPGALDETAAILGWIREELGADTYGNVMGQYYPAGRVNAESYPEINRRLRRDECHEAVRLARSVGLSRLDTRVPARMLSH